MTMELFDDEPIFVYVTIRRRQANDDTDLCHVVSPSHSESKLVSNLLKLVVTSYYCFRHHRL